MDYQYISYALLLQLLVFTCWSGCLYALTLLVHQWWPQITHWSRFWQACFIVSLAPFLPVSVNLADGLIPIGLKNALLDQQLSIAAQPNALANEVAGTLGSSLALYVVLAVVLVGCLYCLIGFFHGVLNVQKMINNAVLDSDLAGFSQPQKAFIEHHDIKVCVTPSASSPFVFGFFKMTICLPEYVLSLPAKRRFLLIEHELMHVKRLDPKAVIVYRLCAAVFWFNPFIACLEKRFMQTMELNCDTAVLSGHPEAKLDYAQALITSIKLSKSQFDPTVITYFSGPGLTKNDFEKRIRSIMSKQANGLYGVGCRLLLTLASSLLIIFAATAQSGLYPKNFNVNEMIGVAPVANAKLTSSYQAVDEFRGAKPHKGIDLGAPLGSDILASFSGKVIIADDTSLHQNYGKVILVEQPNGNHSLYAHLNDFKVQVGQLVLQGQTIGSVGVSGRVSGPHLHFEMLEDGYHVDPAIYLNLKSY